MGGKPVVRYPDTPHRQGIPDMVDPLQRMPLVSHCQPQLKKEVKTTRVPPCQKGRIRRNIGETLPNISLGVT